MNKVKHSDCTLTSIHEWNGHLLVTKTFCYEIAYQRFSFPLSFKDGDCFYSFSSITYRTWPSGLIKLSQFPHKQMLIKQKEIKKPNTSMNQTQKSRSGRRPSVWTVGLIAAPQYRPRNSAREKL